MGNAGTTSNGAQGQVDRVSKLLPTPDAETPATFTTSTTSTTTTSIPLSVRKKSSQIRASQAYSTLADSPKQSQSSTTHRTLHSHRPSESVYVQVHDMEEKEEVEPYASEVSGRGRKASQEETDVGAIEVGPSIPAFTTSAYLSTPTKLSRLASPVKLSSSKEFQARTNLHDRDSAQFRWQALIERFCPIFELHHDEQYFPCSVDYYLSQSELWFGNAKLAAMGQVNEDMLRNSAWIEKRKHEVSQDISLPAARFQLHLRLHPSARPGFPKGEINQAPVYVRIREDHKYWEILYAFLFAFKTFPRFGCGSSAGSDGNFEHVTVRVLKSAYKVTAIYFGNSVSQNGMWQTPAQIHWRGERPLVYLSKGSHGCYPSSSTLWRGCGFFNEHVSAMGDSIEWIPKPILCESPLEPDGAGLGVGSGGDVDVHDSPTGTRWLQYTGEWGAQGTVGLRQQEYWDEEIKRNSSCFQRICGWNPLKWWSSCKICVKSSIASSSSTPALVDSPKEKKSRIKAPLTMPT